LDTKSDAGVIFVDGELFAQGQDCAAMHLCAPVANPGSLMCAKIYQSTPDAALQAARREIAAWRAVQEAYRGDYPPGLVKFVWHGELGSAQPIIIMPHYSVSVADVIHRFLRPARTPLVPAQLARLALGIAAALRALHRIGLAHCDVKPANVMLRPDGWPVLVDLAAVTPFGAKPAEVTRKWVVAESNEDAAGLVASAGPALDLHCLASTVFSTLVASAAESTVAGLPVYVTAWRAAASMTPSQALVATCWEQRRGTASALLDALVAVVRQHELVADAEVRLGIGRGAE
jgi:hypothetical protein